MTRPGAPMHSSDRGDGREELLAEIANSQTDKAALQEHLKEITEGKAFKGSARSIRFLEYIVDQALAGHFDALKERVIGVELFGRSPSYETGEDSIVRVAAGDVRKRLAQHYSIYGVGSEFRLSLPTGSYILDIVRRPLVDQTIPATADMHGEPARSSGPSSSQSHPFPLESESASQPRAAAPPPVVLAEPAHAGRLTWRHWVSFVLLLAAVGLAEWAVLSKLYSHNLSQRVPMLPWSAFFGPSHSTVLITSDQSIAEIQFLIWPNCLHFRLRQPSIHTGTESADTRPD